MYGVRSSVAVAAGASRALLGPAMAPADSGAAAMVAPHPARAAEGVRGGGDGTLITHLHTPPTCTSIASPARHPLRLQRESLTRPDRPWIDAHGVIDVLKRPFVSGTMHWHKDLKVTTTATERRLRGNGLPDHPTGRPPVQKGTPAYKYYVEIPAHGYPRTRGRWVPPRTVTVGSSPPRAETASRREPAVHVVYSSGQTVRSPSKTAPSSMCRSRGVSSFRNRPKPSTARRHPGEPKSGEQGAHQWSSDCSSGPFGMDRTPAPGAHWEKGSAGVVSRGRLDAPSDVMENS